MIQESDDDMEAILASIRSSFDKLGEPDFVAETPHKAAQDIRETLLYAQQMSHDLKRRGERSEDTGARVSQERSESLGGACVTLEALALHIMKPAIDAWLKEHLFILVKTYVSARVDCMLETIMTLEPSVHQETHHGCSKR